MSKYRSLSGAADLGRLAGAGDAAADAARAAAAAENAARVARTNADLGTDFTKFEPGTYQRRISFDNYLKSMKNPPKLLSDTPTINKIDNDLNKIDNIDNITKVDDIPDITPDTKKLINETPENIKADLTPENKVKFDQDYKKLFDEIDKPSFKNKSPKEKWETIKNIVKTLSVTAVGVAFLGMYIKAQIDANRINNTEYRITSITSDNNNDVIVLYDPQDKFTLKDTIIISETNSVPIIDGSGVGLTYAGNGIIKFVGEKITTNGNSGKLRCRTTVEDQFAQNVSNAINPIVDIGANVAGNILDKFIPKGLKDFFKNFWWVILIICILSIISSSAAVAFVYLNN